GAQTAGAIHRVTDKEKLSGAFVQVRLIALDKCPPDFAKDVTRATNTQNRVEAKDFASLDPLQERLRTELLVSGREYLIKAGDKVVDASRQCTAEEAAFALSCASDVALATIAKNSIGRVWDDSPEAGGKGVSIYRKVFPQSLDSQYLWNTVQALRAVDQHLQAVKTKVTSGVCVHGNRFVAAQFFKSMDRSRLFSTNFSVSEVPLAEIKSLVDDVQKVLKTNFKTSYPGALFKHQAKCQEIDERLKELRKQK
ncbi:MAG: hypothetical protein DI536_32515, partial [Archangium gephyra]